MDLIQIIIRIKRIHVKMEKQADEYEEDEELTEFMLDPADQADIEEISFESMSAEFKQGRRIPERWTGVLSLDHDDLKRIVLRDLATDLKMASHLPIPSKARKERNWAPLFFSKDFVQIHKDIKLEDFILPEK